MYRRSATEHLQVDDVCVTDAATARAMRIVLTERVVNTCTCTNKVKILTLLAVVVAANNND